jgi:hypothetical protein
VNRERGKEISAARERERKATAAGEVERKRWNEFVRVFFGFYTLTRSGVCRSMAIPCACTF